MSLFVSILSIAIVAGTSLIYATIGEICGTMAQAVARAAAEAQPGETVLLAPAAASFDQYDNFEQRGDDFTAQVRQRLD